MKMIRKSVIALGVLTLTGWSSLWNLSGNAQQQITTPPSETTAQRQQGGLVKVDGSSTVYPITKAIAQEFQQQRPNIKIDLPSPAGTSGGFKKFCAGETDISDASRPILTTEIEACKKAGIAFMEFPVAFDALTVVVHPQNTWVTNLTLVELRKMWEPSAQGKIRTWKQVKDSWPNRPLNLFGAGKDSGTFDYFTEAVMGKIDESRADYVASEDDDVLVAGISKDQNALGYFGYAYYEENKSKLKAVGIDSGKGPVLPSRRSVERNQYQPLSRPLFIYVSAKAVRRPEVRAFVEFYLKSAEKRVREVGYIPLPPQGYHLTRIVFYRGKVGSIFNGKVQQNLTIGELLRQQAKIY